MQNEWLSLSDAAEMLGVHPSTVRVWSDKGLLPVRKTQGGHRRYQRSEISLWAEVSIGSKLEATNLIQEVIRHLRIQIGDGSLESESWYQKLDADARLKYQASGRSLFHGLMNYITSKDEDAKSEAYAIGYEYASRARRYQLSYVDATRAFLYFRNKLFDAFNSVLAEIKTPTSQIWQMYKTLNIFMDDIQIYLLQTYESLENAKR
ncbi:MAG: MerR family transcriptional regulator [Chloroflexi bacterium OLB14]|nr:MAG: MerR family transcriptional regulator [Chloroflexi bacterium OLB14]